MKIRIEMYRGYMIVGNAWSCLAIKSDEDSLVSTSSKHFDSDNGFAFGHAFDWVANETAGIVA